MSDVVLVPYRPSLTCTQSSGPDWSSYKVSFLALIQSLSLTPPGGRDLRLKLEDHLGSWCHVSFESVRAKKPRWTNGTNPLAILYCYPEDADGQRIAGPFNFVVSVNHDHWLKIVDDPSESVLPVSISLSVDFDASEKGESFNFLDDGSWQVRFDSVELTYGESDVSRVHNSQITELFDPVISIQKGKDRPPIVRSLYYVQRALERWATSAPIARSDVEHETRSAIEMLKGLDDLAPNELGWGIHEYFAKPWARCAELEKAVFQVLVSARCGELIKELESGLNYVTTKRIRQAYGIPLVQNLNIGFIKQRAIPVMWNIVVGVIAGLQYGWVPGLIVFFIFGYLFEISNRSESGGMSSRAAPDVSAIVADLKRMSNASRDDSLSLRYIRERLEELEKRGVEWHWGTLQLVWHAEARNENRW